MTNIAYADLHTHTTASDGVCSPRDNVLQALQAGLTAIAITDHDTVAGIDEAMQEGARIGIEVIPGVEISTVDRGVDVHILGYYLDHHDYDLLHRLSQLRDTRNQRNSLILDRLHELGFLITMEEVNKQLVQQNNEDQTIGRPHIAAALIARGVVSSMKEAFELYLGKSGKAYVNVPRVAPIEAIRWIREAGGKAVLAHPGLYENEQLVLHIIHQGIDGIEAFHSDHSEKQQAYYSKLAEQNGLLVTAGSDFHGSRGGIDFHGAIGSKRITTDVLKQLKGLRHEESI